MSTGAGIFCIETSRWTAHGGRQPSVRHLLRLIESIDGAPYIHRPFSTREELAFLLTQATRRSYRRYPIIYLASHGEDCRIYVRRKRGRRYRDQAVTIAELAEPMQGRANGKVVLFSACEMMKGSQRALQAFVRETGVDCVMGYRREVGWVESAQLELGVLTSLSRCYAEGRDPSIEDVVRSLRSMRQLVRDLDFRIASVESRHRR